MKTFTSVVSSKGQITIPQEIRERLGLRTGDRIEFVVEENRIVVRRAHAVENPFEKYVGISPVFRSRQEINAWVRSLRDDES